MATATQRKTSSVDDKKFEASNASPIDGLPPGQPLSAGDISFEDLGLLSEFPDASQIDNPEQGTGEWLVVLCSILHGAGENDNFNQGDVRRMSRIVPGFDKPSVDRDLVRGRIKRLFTLGAVRKATNEEVITAQLSEGRIPIDMLNETPTAQAERNKRIELERENERLREALIRAGISQDNASPRAGASAEAAQAVVADQNTTPAVEGTEAKGSDWE